MLYKEEEENYDEMAFDEKSDTTSIIQTRQHFRCLTAKITKVKTVKHHRHKKILTFSIIFLSFNKNFRLYFKTP
jgi:hypothetical protein